MPTVAFPQFTLFPLEIRNMIWEHSTEEPRIVHLLQRRLRVDQSIYSQVRSDGLLSAELPLAQGYQYVYMSLEAESRMARALSTFGYTIEHWLEQNIGEWELHNHGRMQGRGLRRYMPTELGADPEDASFYYTRFEEDVAEVQWRNASPDVPKPLAGFKRIMPVPAQLLACWESHAAVLNIYQRAFPTLGCPADVYFNFDRDILHLDHQSLLRKGDDVWDEYHEYLRELMSITTADLRRAQHISLHVRDSADSFEVERFVCALLGTFGNIKRLTLASMPISDALPKLSPTEPSLIMRDNSKHELLWGGLFSDPGHLSIRHLKRNRLSWNKKLRRRRREYKNPELSKWEMPVIDYQLLMTEVIERKLNSTDFGNIIFDDSDEETGFSHERNHFLNLSDSDDSWEDGSSAESEGGSEDGSENDSDDG